MRRVDLNCDLGEGSGHDALLMPLITSVNIACGMHAGDTGTMRETVMGARKHGVAIGAHPGFNDRECFGRRELPVSPGEAHVFVLTQIRLLQIIARQCGTEVGHVKLHGAFYNMASRDTGLADAVASAVYEADPRLALFALAGSVQAEAGRRRGLRVASEVFADRTYKPDGSLTPRSHADAMIDDENAAVAQVLSMVTEGKVRATDGSDVKIVADTVCLHGDGPHPVIFALSVRKALASAGVAVRAFGQ